MSFSFQIIGIPAKDGSGVVTRSAAEDAAAKLDKLDDTVPQAVRDFAKAGIAAINIGDRKIEVIAYGHLHDGEEGNAETTEVTIFVKPKRP